MYFKFLVTNVVRLRCASQKSGVPKAGSAAPWQAHTAMLSGSKFRVALLRLVMQDALRAVFKVWPEVSIKVYVEDEKLHVQTITAGQSEVLRTSRLMQDVQNCCLHEGLLH